MTGNLNDVSMEGVVPAGEYETIPDKTVVMVIITEAERKINKANTGSLIALVMEVVEGSYKGRRLWDWLNIEHPNETAQNIGRGKLAAIGKAIKKEKLIDTSDLLNVPFMVKVGVDDKGESVRNIIREYIWRPKSTSTLGQAPADDAVKW